MKKVVGLFIFPLMLSGLSVISNSSKEVCKADSITRDSNGELVLSILNNGDYIYKESDTDDEEYRTNQRFNDWLKVNYPEFGSVTLKYNTTDTTETMISSLELGVTDCDLMCPSEYGVQKLVNNSMLDTVQDKMEKYGLTNYETYASKTIRNYLKGIKCGKDNLEIVDDYAIGYMWGTLGVMLNPCFKGYKNNNIPYTDVIEDMQYYSSLWDNKYYGSFLIKDSMRDTYFVGLTETYKEELINCDTLWKNGTYDDETYNAKITEILNRCTDKDMANVKANLDKLRANAFGLEVDSGKQDMVIGNIGMDVAWSGDAVYSMDQADEYNEKNKIDVECGLCYAVPKYGNNIWSDCWIMPKKANRSNDVEKAACLFLEFMCDPLIAMENMSWIGYTPYIGGESILEYVRDCYDSRCDLIYVYNEEEDIYYDIAYLDPISGEITEVWFDDCFKEEDKDPTYDNVELYYGVLEFDEEGNITSKIEDLTDLKAKYNERLVIDPEWEEIDLSYMFNGTLSEDYDESDCIFYSDSYRPFVNKDGSQNLNVGRQFFCQYPDEETIKTCVVMSDFGPQNNAMRKMWEDFKSNNIAPWVIVLFSVECVIIVGGVLCYFIKRKSKLKFRKARREKDN